MAGNIDIRNFVNVSILTKGQVTPAQSQSQNFTVVLDFNRVGGTVEADKLSGEIGESVTLTILPYSEYEITSVKINGISQSPSEEITFTPRAGINRVQVIFAKDKLATPVIRLEVV